jgi:hypothetical protein
MNATSPSSTIKAGGWRQVSRQRAFLTHLAISATVVGTVCALIFLVWYPRPYFEIKGAWNVLRVLIGVDLILGPLLTLILFKPGKPGLLLDVVMIAMIQLTAFLYGTSVIFAERPYFAVFAVDRFQVLAKRDVEAGALAGTAYTDKPLVGPLLVVATLPEDARELQKLLEETLFEGKPDIDKRPNRWQPYAAARGLVLQRARPLSELAAAQPEAAAVVARAAAALEAEPADLVYVPAMGTTDPITLIIDRESALPLRALEINPWADQASSVASGR